MFYFLLFLCLEYRPKFDGVVENKLYFSTIQNMKYTGFVVDLENGTMYIDVIGE